MAYTPATNPLVLLTQGGLNATGLGRERRRCRLADFQLGLLVDQL